MTDSWVKELKVGDRVIIGHPFRNPVLATIDRITPSGRIVASNRTFLPDGRQYGGNKFASFYLIQYDVAKALVIKDRDNITYLSTFDYKKLSPEVREQLVKLIMENKP
jgi:hypothetical protein